MQYFIHYFIHLFPPTRPVLTSIWTYHENKKQKKHTKNRVTINKASEWQESISYTSRWSYVITVFALRHLLHFFVELTFFKGKEGGDGLVLKVKVYIVLGLLLLVVLFVMVHFFASFLELIFRLPIMIYYLLFSLQIFMTSSYSFMSQPLHSGARVIWFAWRLGQIKSEWLSIDLQNG